ncbi:glycosyltransferase [Paludifilum halophilum]|uniref:glycosyltransferase n=1 Tax=Paludifilum halophilum TaxID=1642702 RepID=UPI001469A7FD|nr:glycosyltransferase [Paludifilum halophilum]
MSVHLYLDQLPKDSEDLPWESLDSVRVPSFFFRHRLRRIFPEKKNRILLVHPVPRPCYSRWDRDGHKRRTQLRHAWGCSEKRVLLVERDDLQKREIRFLKKITEEISTTRKDAVTLWIPNEGRGKSEPENRNDRRLAADWLLTGGTLRRSLCPLHVEALACGTPVLTTDTGDHGEWIRHGYSGLLLETEHWRSELKMYLQRLAEAPRLTRDLGVNGRRLYETYLRTGEDSR